MTERALFWSMMLAGLVVVSVLGELAEYTRLRRALSRTLSPGRLDARLSSVPETALLLAYCAGPGPVARQVVRYARDLRARPSPIDGRRAQALGLSGPPVGALLRAARTRALDGGSTDDAWLARWLARHG